MRYLTGWLSTPAVGAMVVISVTVTGAEASSQHVRKHHHGVSLVHRSAFRGSWVPGEVRTMAPPPRRAGAVCPGSGRAIDCSVWPPPIDEDPDRRATSSDGG
jgi:hypothetical protein